MKNKKKKYIMVAIIAATMIAQSVFTQMSVHANESDNNFIAENVQTESVEDGSTVEAAKPEETKGPQGEERNDEKTDSLTGQVMVQENQSILGANQGLEMQNESEKKGETPESNKNTVPIAEIDTMAKNKTERTNISITSLDIRQSGKPSDTIGRWSTFDINLVWDASSYGNELQGGDYFFIKLPKAFRFPEESAARNFDVVDDGVIDPNTGKSAVVAKGKVDADEHNGGGMVKITFTDYVENKYNIKGTVRIRARFNQKEIKVGEGNAFEITVGSKVVTININIPPNKALDEVLTKWGQKVTGSEDMARWTMRINHKKTDYKNVTISDELSVEGGASFDGLAFIEGSFVLKEVEMTEFGETIKINSERNISNEVVLAPDKRSFTYFLGDFNKKQYILTYNSTYSTGLVVKNKASIKGNFEPVTVISEFKSAESGGTGSGDAIGKIKILKVDQENNSTVLPGAKFKITRKSDGMHFTLITDSKGEAISSKLIPGEYTIEEVTPPQGYSLNSKVYTIDAKSDRVNLIKITNKKEKVSVPVKKKWHGLKGGSVTVRLFADDVDTGKTLILNEGNSWQNIFTNLDKYNGAKEIKYTVKEDGEKSGKITIDGNKYNVEISGNAKDGYEIFNKRIPGIPPGPDTEKTGISVAKYWKDFSGNKIPSPVKSIKVKLLRNGMETGASLELNESNNWSGSFHDLDVYDSKGNKYVYTVKEVDTRAGKVVFDGQDFFVHITGNMKVGYEISNVKEEPNNITMIEVPVVKKWIGESVESIVVRLFADGKEVDMATLTASNNWMHTFQNLPQYNKGKLIKYTVKEDPVYGYETSIEGNGKGGFTIINKKNVTPPSDPKTAVPGKNKPDPKKPKTPLHKGMLPKTGDNSNANINLMIMVFCGMAGAMLVLMKRSLKSRKNARK